MSSSTITASSLAEPAAARRPVAAKRPLILHWVFCHLRKRGSYEDYLIAAGREAARRGFRMAVVARAIIDADVMDALRGAGVDVQCVADEDLNSTLFFARQVLQLRPELVHCHFGSPSTSLAPIAKMLGVRRFVFTDHGSRTELDTGTARLSPRRLRRRLYGRFIDLYLPVSAFVGDQIVREVGASRDRVLRLFNGVDTQRFRPLGERETIARKRARAFGLAPGQRCVIYVGQLSEAKGVDDLLAIQSEILDRFPDVSVVWIGDGPLGAEVGRTASPRVRHLGLRSDVEMLLPLADVIVAPSRWHEAFCLTVAEAAAAGVPAVAARVGGIPEVVANGETGILFPPGDRKALAGSLGLLLADETLRTRMGTAARRQAQALFSLDVMVTSTFEHYRRLGLRAAAPVNFQATNG
jgi:glycosyltransferase involved in cell wall biosynthesis